MGDHSFRVESNDFHNMIYHLRKDVIIPSADTIKSDIIKNFNNSLKEMRRKFKVSKLIKYLYLVFY